jgi:mannosyltransferase OCH1-like enzyme
VAPPDVVHRIWFGPHPMRRELIEFGRTWERLGYEVRLWTESNLPTLRNQRIYDEVAQRGVNTGGGVPELGVWVQRADIVSYELILEHGGIYANTDMEALRRIPLEGVQAFAGYEDGEFLSNALMGCEAGAKFYECVIEQLAPRYDEHSHQPMNYTTGPHLLTWVYRNVCDELHVFPKQAFNPVLFDGEAMRDEWGDHPDSYAVHHWGHTRDRWTREPDGAFLDARYGHHADSA